MAFVLGALEQAIHDRRPVHRGGLIHHSDRGSQYVSIKYTERLAEAGIEPSVGSVGDSYDSALAETINRLYKAEVILAFIAAHAIGQGAVIWVYISEIFPSAARAKGQSLGARARIGSLPRH